MGGVYALAGSKPLAQRAGAKRTAADRSDLERLIDAHEGELLRYVRFLGASAVDAEDIVQETFLAAFRRSLSGADDLRGEAAWLRGVARNMFLAHYRRRKNGRVAINSEAVEQAERVWTEEYLRGGDGSDYVCALRQCLEVLPEKQRNALALRYTESRSRAEMAQALSVTEDGVKLMLRRIREALAGCIRRRLTSEPP